jgi:hypothetical protein
VADGSSSQRSGLFGLKTIENQFHAGRHAKLIENFEQVISHDSGSTVVGLGIAFLGLDLYRSQAATRSTLLFPLLTAGLPLLDAVLAVVRRLRRRTSRFTGDRNHIYHLLIAQSWPVRRVALAFYGVTAALVGIVSYDVRGESPLFWAIAAISAGLLQWVAIWLGSLRGDGRDGPAQDLSPPATEERYSEPSQNN